MAHPGADLLIPACLENGLPEFGYLPMVYDRDRHPRRTVAHHMGF